MQNDEGGGVDLAGQYLARQVLVPEILDVLRLGFSPVLLDFINAKGARGTQRQRGPRASAAAVEQSRHTCVIDCLLAAPMACLLGTFCIVLSRVQPACSPDKGQLGHLTPLGKRKLSGQFCQIIAWPRPTQVCRRPLE